MNALEEFRRGEAEAYSHLAREIALSPSDKKERAAYWKKMAAAAAHLAREQHKDAGPDHSGTKMMLAKAEAYQSVANLFV